MSSFALNLRTALLAGITALICGSAMAQWQWVDATGRKVFSDTAPPASVPEKNILKRPGAVLSSLPTPVSTAPASATATVVVKTSTAAAPGAPVVTGKDDQLELKKKQAEEAEQAKKKEEQQKLAKARSENCERAKRAKSTLDSGVRIATTNAKGEREILDDKGRSSEAKRLDSIIASDCVASVN